MATGAEREPHGRAKVTYDCESETWLENSFHQQWPSESKKKSKMKLQQGRKDNKNSASSSQIGPLQISQAFTLTALTHTHQTSEWLISIEITN